MEVDNKRSLYFGYRQGLGDSFSGNTYSEQISSRYKNEQVGGESHGSGSRKHVDKGGHKGSHTQTGPIFEQHFCDSKGRGSVPSNHKPKGTEQKYPLPSFQDGGVKGLTPSSPARGLDGETGPQRCIFLGSPGDKVQKICPFPLEEQTLRVPLSGLRLGTSSKDFHKVDESAHIPLKKDGRSTGDISGRPSHLRLVQRRAGEGKGLSNVSLPSPGVDRIRKENGKVDFSVSKDLLPPQDLPERPLLPHREVKINSGSGHTRPITGQIPAANLYYSSIQTDELRTSNLLVPRGQRGVKVVGREFETPERRSYSSSSSRSSHLLGCSKDRGLGGSLPPGIYRGSVVGRGETIRYQCPGTAGSRTGHKDLHQEVETLIHSHEDRQHLSPVLSGEDGGDKESGHVGHSQKDMAIPYPTRDHDYCGVDTITPEHRGRLGVQECIGLSRVETVPTGIPIDVSGVGIPRLRSIRVKDIPSGQSLLQLEGRSRLTGSGRLLSDVEQGISLRLSPLLSDIKGVEASAKPESSKVDSSYTNVAVTTLIPCSYGNVHTSSFASSRSSRSVKKPGRPKTSSGSGVISETSGLASIRDRLSEKGVSIGASNLILNSRSRGTTINYESAWEEWLVWCNSRNVDPFGCPVKDVLNYLGSLFDSGYQYRSIGVHRSAISAYHQPINQGGLLMAIGKHPEVCALMSGVQKLRPPTPKYAFTWDVEAVLNLFRSWPGDLSPKQLTIKVATLLFLIGVPREAELHMLNLNYLSKFEDRYVFDLAGNIKNGKEGTIPKPVIFHRHPDEEKLCPIVCIDEYLLQTDKWRPEGTPAEFFLSFKTHKAVCKSSIARWVKEALLMAEVDTDIFQAHSMRGAATSKAFLKGLSVTEVVNHGKWSSTFTINLSCYHPKSFRTKFWGFEGGLGTES